MQSGGTLRGPASAPAGGSIEVEAPGAETVIVHFSGSSDEQEFDVGADGKVTVSIPATASGSVTITDGNFPKPAALSIPIVSSDGTTDGGGTTP